MQMAVIEAARNLTSIPDPGSSEFGIFKSSIVGLLLEWTKGNSIEIRSSEDDLGGSMRLGAYECHISDGTLAKRYLSKGDYF